MGNLLGKLMVQAHLAISVLAFGWAASMYFDVVDWGWKVPRKDIDTFIASEYDKRVVHQREGLRRRDFNYLAVKDAWSKVREAEEYFVQNNLWYEKELTRLASAPGNLEIRRLKYVDGQLELETPEKPLGKPVFQEKPLEEITKSRRSYLGDFNLVQEDIRKVETDFLAWQKKHQDENTQAVVGKFDKDNKKIEPGLADLRQQEYEIQSRIYEEMRYLQPREIDFRKDAEIYRDRRENLEQRRKALLDQLPERSRKNFAN